MQLIYFFIIKYLLVTKVTVNGVTNPTSAGGTGSFILKTLKGENLLDENYIFGSIGIAGSIGTILNLINNNKKKDY